MRRNYAGGVGVGVGVETVTLRTHTTRTFLRVGRTQTPPRAGHKPVVRCHPPARRHVLLPGDTRPFTQVSTNSRYSFSRWEDSQTPTSSHKGCDNIWHSFERHHPYFLLFYVIGMSGPRHRRPKGILPREDGKNTISQTIFFFMADNF